ncbi:hypothetical protein EON81_22140 [bacterium]|nr:MAG: hypothetical protein EON81_22140 [bacterium]
MAKVTPRPAGILTRKPTKKVITHESLEVPIVLFLFPLNSLRRLAAKSISDELIERHLTGGWIDEAGEWREEPEPFPPIDEVPVVLSEDAIRTMARIEAMQDPLSGDVYNVREDLIPWATINEPVWDAIYEASIQVMDEQGKKEKAETILSAKVSTG